MGHSNSELERIKKSLERKRRELLESRERLREGYIATNTLSSQTVRIRKDSLPALKDNSQELNHLSSSEHPFYSLWASDSPIFLVEWLGKREDELDVRGTFVYIFTTRKTENFRLAHYHSYFFNSEAIVMAHQAHGLKSGDYCNLSGHKITGRNLEIAQDLFNRVISGVKIFPFENVKGYIERNVPVEMAHSSDRQSRSYGQEFLRELSPDRVVEGELFVPGISYRAYFFGGKVVLESNLSGDATYLLDAKHFDALRERSRLELLTEKPEGFLGRVLHLDGAEAHWKIRVENFVKS